MEEFDLVYKNIILRICCASEIAKIVKEHFLGHVIVKEPSGDATVTLIVSEKLIIKNCEKYSKVDKWFNYASLDFYIDNLNRQCYITNINAQNDKEKDLLISSSIANVFNRILELEGYIGVHASCVEKDDCGLLFVAERNSGKTVCMLNLMDKGFNIVANDIVALKKDNGNLMAYGIAQSSSIRLSPSFCKQSSNEKYVKLAKERNIQIQDKDMLDGNNLHLSDYELAKLNNVSQTIDVPIKAIVRPYYDPTVEKIVLYPMPIEHTRELIYSQYKSLVHETSDFLINLKLDGVDEAERYKHFEDIISVPAYYCRQNENTTEEFVRKMNNIRNN